MSCGGVVGPTKPTQPTTTPTTRSRHTADNNGKRRGRAARTHPNQCIHSIQPSPSTPISQAPSVDSRAAGARALPAVSFEALDRSRRLLHHVGTCVRGAVREPPTLRSERQTNLPHHHTHIPITTLLLLLQDSNFAAVSRYRGFLEVIDAEWMADSLSDDGALVGEGWMFLGGALK